MEHTHLDGTTHDHGSDGDHSHMAVRRLPDGGTVIAWQMAAYEGTTGPVVTWAD